MFKDFTQTDCNGHTRAGIVARDDTTSLVLARDARHQEMLRSQDLKDEARRRLSELLQQSQTADEVRALEAGSPETQARVRKQAEGVVKGLQQRGLTGLGPVISDELAEQLVAHVLDWQFGTGPLEPLFRESDVEDIIVNSAASPHSEPQIEVWTYRQSGKRREDIAITPDDVREIVNRNAALQGRALNTTSPLLNAQMRFGQAAGSRINAVLNPACDPEISVTIRIHRPVAAR
ncbi:MAG: hypothetical protein HC853_14915 [Anaerolineae bacterium]|nr:hypothetical protein [Anaerolineae bacterium]